MVLEAKTDAPELALDNSTQAGFCKWFQSLPQVRLGPRTQQRHPATPLLKASSSSTSCPLPAVCHPCALLLSCCLPQDPQVIKFFDRKVGQRGQSVCPSKRLIMCLATTAARAHMHTAMQHMQLLYDPPHVPVQHYQCWSQYKLCFTSHLDTHTTHTAATQGFYSVHGEAALFIARDFYRTLAVVKYLGGPPPSGTPGNTSKTAGGAAGGGGASATPKASTPASSSKAGGGSAGGLASVTLNRSLFEGVLRSLLLEGGQHSVELWEGAGANWSLAK